MSRDSFAKLEFVAWDSEGINVCQHGNDGDECKRKCDGWVDEWTAKQKLVLVGNSLGAYIYNDEGLQQKEIIEFLFAKKYGANVRHTFFGGSYDFNKILEGLPAHTVKKLHEKKGWTFSGEYAFRYRPRKELAIARVPDDYNPLLPLQKQAKNYIRFWDVIGFFQASFLTVLREWLDADYPDYDLIASGKLARLSFSGDDRDFMIQYNLAECRALVVILNKLREQMDRTNLRVRRWDGAGAVAGELFRARELRKAFYDGKEKIRVENEIDEASRYSYFGGRIESGYMGHFKGPIYSYDINSAYPFAASQLPNLNHGDWERTGQINSESDLLQNDVDRFSLFRVQWYFHNERRYYPFPFRNADNSVIFPRSGERWIFYPELLAAIRSLRGRDQLRVYEGWQFKRANGTKPFEVLPEIYRQRQQMILTKDPAQMVLKLGLNSVYGKLCQRVGWNEKTGEAPAFHQLLFAGWITSYVRGMIYGIVSQAQSEVISINTDGLISTALLPIIPSEDKSLGGWTLETYDEIVQLQSGVYWLRKGKYWKERARGLGRVIGEGETEKERIESRNTKIIKRIDSVLDAWENGSRSIHVPVKLFVTSHKALTGPDWFPRWGHWYIMHDDSGKIGRAVELRCTSWGKRRLNDSPGRNKLVPTVAAENIDWSGKFGVDDLKRRDLGAPYELPWLGGPRQAEQENDLEIIAL